MTAVMTAPDKVLFYPVWISPGRKAGGWSWGQPCDTAAEAAAVMKAELATGATLGCIVEFSGGRKTPMPTSILPTSARKIVAHLEQLWDATE